MRGLLDDLVEFTRHRLGAGLAIEPTPFDLEQFARNTLDEIDAISTGRAIKLNVQGDTQGQWDARRLHQALSNLVFNALKYGFPQSPIDVRINGTNVNEVLVTVANAGKPISPELVPKLFDPLVRIGEPDDAASQIAGANLGLGLYVVREIAKAHGGTVELTSDASMTQFSLKLPRHCALQASST